MHSSDNTHNDLHRHWADFHQSGISAANHRPGIVKPIIFDSWLRCKAHFDTPPPTAPAAAAQPISQPQDPVHTRLISTGLPYLEDIYQILCEEDEAVFLTDAAGTIIAVQGRLPYTQQIGLSVGASWAEDQIGTNAVGLALLTAMPVQVVGAEHFLQSFHAYSDAAASIHNEQGVVIGAVGFVTYNEMADPTQVALVMSAAQAITAQLRANVMLEQANQRLRQLNHILEAVTEGVLTWNTKGVIEHVNDRACQILGVARAALLGEPIHNVIKFSEYIQGIINDREELSDVETTIRVADRIVRCVVSLRVIRDGSGEMIGGIAMLRTASQVHSWLNQQTSTLSAMTFDDLEFQSGHMADLMREAKLAARGSLPVLIQGESGVGKTTLAQAIHNAGPRASKPFVVINCEMISSEYIVEALLGVEAHRDEHGRPGKFELADGGTLVIDHIDQLSLEAQQILLNVMNSRTVTRLNVHRTKYVNVRIIATTNSDLNELAKMGAIVSQLYYLFNVLTLRMAPLRERREDIPSLIRRFLNRLGADRPVTVTPEVTDVLRTYPWPGNVRELQNVIERALIHATDQTITRDDLPENIRTAHSLLPDDVVPKEVISLEEAEREAIIRAGWAYQGSISVMADALGINRTTLWRKFKQYRLKADDFRTES